MKIAVLIFFMILFTVSANLMLKVGVSDSGNNQFHILSMLFNTKVLLGLLFFGCGAMFYLILLKNVPLSVAQCFTALQFAGSVIAARLILEESVTPVQWGGIILIFLGVVIVGFSQQPNI